MHELSCVCVCVCVILGVDYFVHSPQKKRFTYYLKIKDFSRQTIEYGCVASTTDSEFIAFHQKKRGIQNDVVAYCAAWLNQRPLDESGKLSIL